MLPAATSRAGTAAKLATHVLRDYSLLMGGLIEGRDDGGEGEIRTPDSLATMSDFESGAFNRALPPLRVFCFLCRNT